MVKNIKSRHGEDSSICFVGHSEGGAAALFTSIYLQSRNYKHVSISPENGEDSETSGPWKDIEFLKKKNNSRSENLTILIGGDEISNPDDYTGRKPNWKKTNHFRKFYALKEKAENVKVELVGKLNHEEMASPYELNVWGPAVLEGCGYK